MDVISSWTGARADALRRALRMSNEAFAERLGAAVRTVAYWQSRPDSAPQPVMQEALDTMLAHAPEGVQARFRLILAERERENGSLQHRVATAPFTPINAELTCDPARPENLSLSSEVPSLTPSAPRARLATPGDLARVRGVRAHLKAIDNAHGGGTALPMATMYLRSEILPLLDGGAKQAHTKSLIEAVAEYELDVGWMAYDAGQQDVAEQYFLSALRRARAVGNRLLEGRVLASMSRQAIHMQRVQGAIELAQAARSATASIATPRALAMEAAMEACSYAAAGDARQSHRALDDAANAVTLINASGEPDPEWLDFDEGGFWGHAARTYRDLGELCQAEDAAQKSVALCLPSHSRTRAQRWAILATARLRKGELEAAIDAGEQVICEASGLQSGHVFGEVAQLAAAMAPFKTRIADEFLLRVRELLTARGQLAAGH
jgi:tetratricopeptide (TPR) repeat protein